MRLYLSSFRNGNKPEELLKLLGEGRRTALIFNAQDWKSAEDRATDLVAESERLRGCGLGGLATIETGGWGCLIGGPILARPIGVVFGVYGFIAGGTGMQQADAFSTGANSPNGASWLDE